jgi:hypothetical protein
MFPSMKKPLPFSYGDRIHPVYSTLPGFPQRVTAAHNNPAVLLREMGLYSRTLPEEALDTFRGMRRATGEYSLLKKLLGDVDPYSYIPPKSGIPAASSALKELTDQMIKGKALRQEAIDAIRPNTLTRMLSRGAHSLRGLESSGKNLFNKLIAYLAKAS